MDEFLKTEMRARGWNVSRLAEACDVSIGLAAKWVTDKPRYRVRPNPLSCAKIAVALGVDLDQVLALAGHRASPAREAAARTQLAGLLKAVEEQYERWVAAVGIENEPYFWQHLKVQGDSAVALIRGLGTAVSAPADTAVKRGVRAWNGLGRRWAAVKRAFTRSQRSVRRRSRQR